jgi:hypothetical protein
MTVSVFPIDDRVEPSALRIPTTPIGTNLHVESATGGELVLSFPGTKGCSAADRDAVLRRLHDERRALVARRREGSLPEPEADYLRDIEREIDRLELAEETERSAEHPAWPRLEKLLERVLELQAEYGEGTSQDKL